MKATIIFSIAIFLGAFAFSQTCTAPVTVLVTDMQQKPYAGDKIIFKGQKSSKTFSGISNAKGTFLINLPCGDVYDIKVSSVGEEMEYNTLEIPMLKAGEKFDEMELQITYELPSEFILQELQFETAKATIRPSSFPSLDIVADFLKRKPAMTIEIAGHTDSDGDDQMNLKLSNDRANAVKTYLISKGVRASQLKATGYGETRPIADNNSASGKQQNRRTEIQIIQ